MGFLEYFAIMPSGPGRIRSAVLKAWDIGGYLAGDAVNIAGVDDFVEVFQIVCIGLAVVASQSSRFGQPLVGATTKPLPIPISSLLSGPTISNDSDGAQCFVE